MKKKHAALLSLLLAAVLLCGCGSVFDKEYVAIDDYVPTVQDPAQSGERVTVRNFTALKQAIRTLVSNGETEGSIVFDAAYDGDTTEDMASACWQVRTQDALCAYCVSNIAYDTSGEEAESIIKLPYSTGLERLIESAFEQGQTKLVVLINRSALSAEDMEGTAARVYRENPATAPKAPSVSVNMYSGANMQRLYEINLRYGMGAEELAAKKRQLARVTPFEQLNIEELDEAERALAAYEYLVDNCSIADEGQGGSIYAALVEHSTDSEGAALAFVELCRQLKVDCQIVYGQRAWRDHCWNIIRVNGDYYHVDAGLTNADINASFLKTDQDFWESYRWDVSAYPVCSGALTYDDLAAQESPAEEAPQDEAGEGADDVLTEPDAEDAAG